MMYCDFKTVTNVIYRQLVKSSIKSYCTFINMLFNSYNASCQTSQFSDSLTSKLRKGRRIPASSWVEYYKINDRAVLLEDISVIIPLLLDKEQLQRSLYHLYCDDECISEERRSSFGNRFTEQYTDDDIFANMLYKVLLIAVIRHYEKSDDGNFFRVVLYNENSYENIQDSVTFAKDNDFTALFSNSEYIPPCEYFCGRDEELSELHDLVKKKSKVMVVGVRSIGKSELVRAFIKKFGTEYDHIGYYHYSIEQSDNVRPRNLWNIIYEINGESIDLKKDNEYKKNLVLLSSIGRKTLLVIDSFNVPASYDKHLRDILRLKCDVILISYMNYDDMTVYKVRDFRKYNNAYALIQSYYPFNIKDAKIESEIHRLVQLSHRNPYILSVCGKYLMKGVATLDTITTALCRKNYKYMSARISTKKDGEFQEKANYHELLAKVANLAEFSDTDRYVLSYMRFMPKFGVAKLLFVELIALDDINVIENLIDLGLIQEDKGGTISLPSIVGDIIESDVPLKQEKFANFAKKFFDLDLNKAPKNVLSDIANNISPARYMEMYESDRFMSAHMLYRFNYKIGDLVAMYLMITALSAFRDPNSLIQTGLYNSDRKLLFEELGKLEDSEMLKAQVIHEDKRFHSGIPLPRHRTIIVEENEDGSKMIYVDE